MYFDLGFGSMLIQLIVAATVTFGIYQLYLALRLAVAEALTPEAPLVLDDIFVRFDDDRMEKAVALLRELAEIRQVILFTCQGRETQV